MRIHAEQARLTRSADSSRGPEAPLYFVFPRPSWPHLLPLFWQNGNNIIPVASARRATSVASVGVADRLAGPLAGLGRSNGCARPPTRRTEVSDTGYERRASL